MYYVDTCMQTVDRLFVEADAARQDRGAVLHQLAEQLETTCLKHASFKCVEDIHDPVPCLAVVHEQLLARSAALFETLPTPVPFEDRFYTYVFDQLSRGGIQEPGCDPTKQPYDGYCDAQNAGNIYGATRFLNRMAQRNSSENGEN